MRFNASRFLTTLLAATSLLAACVSAPPRLVPLTEEDLVQAEAAPDTVRYKQEVETLSSDDFEGRAPGTTGEDRTVAWLQAELERRGIPPAYGARGYLQEVPMTMFTSSIATNVNAGGQALALRPQQDVVSWTYLRQPRIDWRQMPMVFAGHGVLAPEWRWDDFKGVDVRGKIVVVLDNDPQVPDKSDPAKLDPASFDGVGVTWYGRWEYKAQEAARRGAAGVMIVSDLKLHKWAVTASGNRELGSLNDGRPASTPPLLAWIHPDRAKALFAAAGLDLEVLRARASRHDFEPIPMTATLDVSADVRWRDVVSHNVVARIAGAEEGRPAETVVYSAHWDHLGWDRSLPGPKSAQVFHGALDNASGVVEMLDIASEFRRLPRPPRRTIVFIATTGEELGALGAAHYVAHPLAPLDRTLVDVNIDGAGVWGRAHQAGRVGGRSDVDEVFDEVVRRQGREPTRYDPDIGAFRFRSDATAFERGGVPSFMFDFGNGLVDKPAGYEGKKGEEDLARYHSVTDVVQPDWDLSGLVDDERLLFRIGLALAEGDRLPQWRDGEPFKSVRDASMRTRVAP